MVTHILIALNNQFLFNTFKVEMRCYTEFDRSSNFVFGTSISLVLSKINTESDLSIEHEYSFIEISSFLPFILRYD